MISGSSLGSITAAYQQRRPSFPQCGGGGSGGDWGRGSKHTNGKPAPTAASMAEMPDEDDDLESPLSPSGLPIVHSPHCRLALVGGGGGGDPNSLRVPDNKHYNSDTNSGGVGGGVGGEGVGGGFLPGGDAVCSCQLSYVTLGGLTSPDGSKTPLSTALTNNNKKKARRPRGAKPTVIFNVGGQTFETYRSTLKRFKNSFFADDDKLRTYFRPTQGDYFFDRDPTAFSCVLNYLRTGDLHVPTTMCGPALQTELEFWGIEELDIERCCWTQYNTWKTQSRSLAKLEYDRKFSTTQNLESRRRHKDSGWWGRKRATMWQFLQDPGSSRAAKVYAWVSIIFVFISIFSFCADTHPVFRVRKEDVGQFASIYRFFHLEAIHLDPPNASLTTPLPSSPHHHHNNLTTQGQDNSTIPSALEDGEGENEEEEDLPHPSLLILDMCCLIFFTLEYLTRFICSPSKVNFLRSFQNVIDFVAISPDYVELVFLLFGPSMRREGMSVMDLMFILRMLRLCRIFRLIRHVPGLWILLYTLKASFNELMLMFVFLLIGMVVFATLMHFAEGENGFPNIPVGFWWSVVTMTTVGYGDMFPQTAAGYVIGSCCAVAGLLMIAFTVPIIVSNFVLYYTHVQYGLARRDRELERIDEEGQVHGDEENPTEPDLHGADRKAAVFSLGPPKAVVDSEAVARGEDVALTSSPSTDAAVEQEERVRFEDEKDSSTDQRGGVVVVV